jgi:hypothetical protein
MDLLADSGTAAAPRPLKYHLDGTASGDESLVFQKSDGSYWIAIWNEADSPHGVTVTLPDGARQIDVYDPLSGETPTQTTRQTSSAAVNLTDHVLLVRVMPRA